MNWMKMYNILLLMGLFFSRKQTHENYLLGVRIMVFNTAFNNSSLISWQSDLLVEENGEQDNARHHVARVCQDFLANHNISPHDWPPYSPDLSPIEHLWDESDAVSQMELQS
jgi:hypothetical protein